MNGYSEFTLAEVIANVLDGEYDDEHEVFTSAHIENGFQVIVKVTAAEGPADHRRFVVTVEDMDD